MANTEVDNTQLNVLSLLEDEQSTCSNCKAQLIGPYCAQCGQGSESTIKYFWLVMLHLLDDIFSFDSRASRTVWPLVTRPGFLTNEYILGRRVHYVPPLRLYLFISIVFFITLKFFAVSENNNIINLGNDDSVITQVTTHISELEQQRGLLLKEENQEQQRDLLLKEENQEKPIQSDALVLVEQELEKFNIYKIDLANESNKVQKAIAGELVELEFRRINSGQFLQEKSQERYNNLTQKLAKVRSGEKIKLLSIGNNSDGSLSFPFLSAEKNVLLNDLASQLEEKASKVLQSDTGPLLEQVISKLPQLMFVLLPLFAALLKIMYLFSKRFYMEHLTVALHSHSFVFINILLLEFIDMMQDHIASNWQWLDTTLDIVSFCLLAWIPIYLFIMQKRVYKQGYILTTIKYVIVGMAYSGLISIAAMVAFIWGLTNV